MFCPNCGKPCADGMRFCQYCGTPLQDAGQPASAGPAYNQGAASRPAAAPAYTPMRGAESPVMSTLRRMARSPLYLTCAIGYTCMILFTLASSLTGGMAGGLVNTLSMLAGSSYEMNYLLGDLYSVMPVITGVSFGSALVGQIPAILVAVGIWLVFVSAMDNSGAPLKTTGLTIIRVIQIISLVLSCLMFLLIEVLIIIVIATVGRYDDSATGIFLVIMLLVAVIAALDILYYVKLMGTINSIRQSIWRDEPFNKISAYVAVLSIIGGAGSLFSLLVGGVFGALASLGAATAGIGFGIFLFQYRGQMNNLMIQQSQNNNNWEFLSQNRPQ